MAEILRQLRLVVYPTICEVSAPPIKLLVVGCFLKANQPTRPQSYPPKNSRPYDQGSV